MPGLRALLARVSGGKELRKTNAKEIEDLTALEEITFENVLDCLVERYSLKQYYTFAGTLLISLNPCLQNSRRSLTPEQLNKLFQDHEKGGISPHVFSVGRKCLTNLKTIGNNQVIVVSGNSGAGKTTATQQLLRYFVELNRTQPEVRTPNGLDNLIFSATLVLESLGNASTVVNQNSSRFGRFVQLNYESNSGAIVGAQIRTCLLEKHRVAKCSELERNFHIFYYILASLEAGKISPAQFIDRFENGMEWKKLIPAYFHEGVRPSDAEQLQTLNHCLVSLKMCTELEKVYGVLFGIMILLNIRFIPSEEQDGKNAKGEVKFEPNQQNIFTIEDVDAIEILSDVLGLERHILVDTLVCRKIIAGLGRSRRQSEFHKPCESVRECEERTAALTSHLYDAIFHHILACLNSVLNVPHDGSFNPISDQTSKVRNEQLLTLSLLDLYGFENLENNQLEQLCINYANERLQKVLILKMKSHFEEVATWEVGFKALELDNVVQEASERLESMQCNLFNILNEECMLSRVKLSDTETYGRLQMANADSKYIKMQKLQGPELSFLVKHYAMDVKYDMKGLTGKNSDKIPPEFNAVFGDSKRPFLKSLIENLTLTSGSQETTKSAQGAAFNQSIALGTPVTAPKSSISRSQRDKTILQRFKASVDSLMSELGIEENQDVHFIRCIRPNNELTEGKIQKETVRQQLLCSGVVDVIRITGHGFPIRIPKYKFSMDFPLFTKTYFKKCEGILDPLLSTTLNMGDKDLKFGKTQIFLTERTWILLKSIEKFILKRNVSILQRTWRDFVKRQVILNAKRNRSLEEPDLVQRGDFPETKSPPTILFHCGDGDAPETKSPLLIAPISFPQQQRKFQFQKNTFQKAIEKLGAMMKTLNLQYSDGIVSRGSVEQGPIHIYLKTTVLPYGHVFPKRLVARGCEDVIA